MQKRALDRPVTGRRAFLRTLSLAMLAAPAGATAARAETGETAEATAAKEAEVTPGEDLMQEHGVLERLLLVYQEAARRMKSGEPLDVAVVGNGAGIVRKFVEDYHERLEEELVFPRLEAAKREVDLVAVLRRQHRRGREVTDEVIRLSGTGKPTPRLAELLLGFERMYRPHAAREDTVLFPTFRVIVGGAVYRELGEEFEDREHARFGEHGFADTVAEVARLEKALGIENLANFTQA